MFLTANFKIYHAALGYIITSFNSGNFILCAHPLFFISTFALVEGPGLSSTFYYYKS